ncbi:hypothetical protein D3C74_60290 [compost metagenome]
MHTPTIRTEIREYLEEHELSMSEFAATAELNAGTVSVMVKSNRALSVHQLDSVTKAMGKPEDYFYTRYIQEYILGSSVDWRRAKNFLQRCMELNRLDCIEQVVGILMDNISYYAAPVFDLAEDFFAQDQWEAAAILYKNVAFNERHQHSERLAVCQYRLFKIRIGDDQVQNLKAAVEFDPYTERLDEVEQLDALKDLANLYRSLGKWDKVFELAQAMGQQARILYEWKYSSKREDREQLEKIAKLSGPLFGYIAYSDLLSASACDERGDYEQGARFIQAYADLSWVKEQDEEAEKWKRSFLEWAASNACLNKLMAGDIRVLPEYVQHIDQSEEDIFVELINVIEAAMRHNVDIDDIIERFEPKVMDSWQREADDVYTRQVLPGEVSLYWYKLAKYKLLKGVYSYGLKCLINSLEISSTINHTALIISSMGLYEQFRTFSDVEVQAQYSTIIRRVWDKENEKDGFYFGNY